MVVIAVPLINKVMDKVNQMALTAQLNQTDLEEEEETEDGFVMITSRPMLSEAHPFPQPLSAPSHSPSEDCAASHLNDEIPIEGPSIQTIANDFISEVTPSPPEEAAPLAAELIAPDPVTASPPGDPHSSAKDDLSSPPPPPPPAAALHRSTPPAQSARTLPPESEIGSWLAANQLEGRFEEVFQLYGLRDLHDVALMEEEVLLDILFQSPSSFLPADCEVLLVKIAALRSEHFQRLAQQESEDAALARRLQEEENQT